MNKVWIEIQSNIT